MFSFGRSCRRLNFSGTCLSSLVVFLAVSPFAGAQEKTAGQTLPAPAASGKAPQVKLTTQQKQGLRLLKAAQAEASGLQPDMRAFVLWQVSRGYATTAPARANVLLREAFLATQSIEKTGEQNCPISETCQIKDWLQEQILSALLKASAPEVQQLLPRSEPAVQDSISAQLIRYYTKKKDFDKAREWLNSVADAERYPYTAAMQLMADLPQERSGDLLAIFTQALSNFEQHSSSRAGSQEDFGTMIVRFWKRLPSDAVLDAISKILAAPQPDAKEPMTVTISGEKGNVSLNSIYELRLFQLLPVLQQLDPARAKDLMRDHADVEANMQRYPGGMESVNDHSLGPTEGEGQSTSRSMTSFTSDSDPAQAAAMQAQQQRQAEMQRRTEQIIREAPKAPRQAIANALALPLMDSSQNDSPRVNALQGISGTLLARDTEASRAALDEIVKVEDQIPVRTAKDLSYTVDTYLHLGDDEGARKALNALLKTADRLYAADNDADDPNKAFKGLWPSTDLWRRCMQMAAKLSPDLPEEMVAGINDPEIAAYEKVAFANSLLRTPAGIVTVVENHKTGMMVNTIE